jgi:hypothetical protein
VCDGNNIHFLVVYTIVERFDSAFVYCCYCCSHLLHRPATIPGKPRVIGSNHPSLLSSHAARSLVLIRIVIILMTPDRVLDLVQQPLFLGVVSVLVVDAGGGGL